MENAFSEVCNFFLKCASCPEFKICDQSQYFQEDKWFL